MAHPYARSMRGFLIRGPCSRSPCCPSGWCRPRRAWPGSVTKAAVPPHWHPKPTTAPWQWQLQGRIDTAIPAAVYDVDAFEVPRSVVRKLHEEGRKVICYLDVGSWESYRPDAGEFPRSVIGRRYEGFPNERWLDIRHFHSFADVLQRRFDLCASKGFDAVEPDNIAGWEKKTRQASRSRRRINCASTAGSRARCMPGEWRWP